MLTASRTADLMKRRQRPSPVVRVGVSGILPSLSLGIKYSHLQGLLIIHSSHSKMPCLSGQNFRMSFLEKDFIVFNAIFLKKLIADNEKSLK